MIFQVFEKQYSRIILFGLVIAIWFSTLAQAAHDLWAACILFGWVTFLYTLFCFGRFRDGKRVKLPLLLPSLIILVTLWVSSYHSYEIDTTRFEAWGWTFSFLIFYLFLNVIDTTSDVDIFFILGGLVIIPLTILCVWEQITLHPLNYGQWIIPLPWIKPGLVWTFHYGHWEIHATLIKSIVMAGFLLYWPIFFWEKTLNDRRWSWIFIACLVSLTLARSWWAAISLLGGFFYYYFEDLKDWAKSHRFISTCSTLLFTSIIGILIALKLQFGQEGMIYLSTSRWYYWLTALRVWRYHPWLGVGLGGYANAYPYYKVGQVQNTLFTHSFPLQLLAETGSVGGFVILVWVWNYLRIRIKETSATRIRICLPVYDSALISVLCFSLISINMDYLLNKITFLLFLVPGLLMKDLPEYRIRRTVIATFAFALLLISSFWLSLFAASRLYTAGQNVEAQGNIVKAKQLYLDSISLDSYHSYSYWALSRIYGKAFEKSHSREDLLNALSYINKAFQYNKSPQFLKELLHYQKWLNTYSH